VAIVLFYYYVVIYWTTKVCFFPPAKAASSIALVDYIHSSYCSGLWVSVVGKVFELLHYPNIFNEGTGLVASNLQTKHYWII